MEEELGEEVEEEAKNSTIHQLGNKSKITMVMEEEPTIGEKLMEDERALISDVDPFF